MTETAISLAIRKALTARGAKVLRLNAGGYGRIKGVEPGTPDLCVLHGVGDCTWLEVKGPKGELSPVQHDWHLWARAHGFAVHVVRSAQEAIDVVFPF